MKKIYLLLLIVFPLVGFSRPGNLTNENAMQVCAMSGDNTFTFMDAYFVWNEERYMLDYAIVALNNPPLDAPITLSYRVYASNGYSKLYSYVIPAGSTYFQEEGTTLGENIITDMGLNPYQHDIVEIVVYQYEYRGNMEIVGLDSLDAAPPGVFGK